MNANAVECRRIGMEQLDPLLVLEDVCFNGDRFTRRNLRHLLRSPSAEWFGAFRGHELIGNVVVLFRRNTRVARIYSIAVHPSARRSGAGYALLLNAEREARKRGCNRIRLEVRMDNIAAIQLYERLGFEGTTVLPGLYEDGTHGLLYWKKLDASSTPII